ncbi:FCD domain-containing protein [Conexibacter sp. JD483]|uniref:FadR/GntR family transcriptional regulator n=1 Tax=unclassified Conexibacter TaxID=2627773 RepID=UPI00272809F2|nr:MULTISPECIES: FCD domain-containing protein [unclassified Conexibacter]MDO8187934.1 FCD domain-containing protein [Conexibacter sp. CPCC 205706]MDO8200197.1 FCD domain-containing protein [Conexibacter sp. CPCC 205762]MDR9369743.1 FCD domain-containing protein [Conexibacter sp. JD483]
MSAPAHPLRSTRIAELVAGAMRDRILSGELVDGERLPKEDELRAEFGVGRPAMREAMRILEAEGLLTVLRGNRGGALVRTPRAENLAYTLGLLLSARKIRTRDVGHAMRELEPACAALCALRADRERTVVPALLAVQERSIAAAQDSAAVTACFRDFHEQLVAGCGNETMIALVGALERLWSSHVRTNATRAVQQGKPRPPEEIRQSLADHQQILDCIRDGDADGVRAAVTRHVARVQTQPRPYGANVAIDLATLRAGL